MMLGAALILLLLAALAGLVRTASRRARGLPYVLGAGGAAVLAVAGGLALAGRAVTLSAAGWLGDPLPGQRALGLAADRLSGLFLLLAFGAAVPVSVAFASWAAGPGSVGAGPAGEEPAEERPGGQGPAATRMLAQGYALALGAVAVTVTARDVFTFLFGWEALTGAFYLLAGARRGEPDRAGAARVTVALGKVSGAALLTGLLLLAAGSNSITLASLAHAPGGAARTAALVLLLGGFSVKAGLVPFQVWFPRGYPAAPGPARALMAGVCVNVAFYGMWRTLALLGRPPGWLAGTLLLLGGFAVKAGLVPFQVWLPRGYAAAPGPARAIMAGVCVNVAFYGMWRTFALIGRAPGWLTGGLLVLGALSALLGIAHAAVQNRLSRVIAYSSVENTGLIVTGFGVALTGAAVGDRRLVAAGLLAATLQVVTHTMAKSLLFTSSAGIEAATGADDLEELRGRARRTPWSGFGLAVGSLTLAGLPPTVGFVSEWFLLESLMQQFRVPGLGYRLVLALAGAAVALTVGFAGVTFVRLVSLVCLGGNDPPRPPWDGPAGRRWWCWPSAAWRPRRSRRWRSG